MSAACRAPIVADDHRGRRFECVKDAHHIADQMEDRVLVDSLRPVTLAVPAHVGRNGVETRRSQRIDLVAPRIPALRKTVA
jgi:hypothetical protein